MNLLAPFQRLAGWIGRSGASIQPGEAPAPSKADGLLRDLRGRGINWPGTEVAHRNGNGAMIEEVREEKVRGGPNGVIMPLFLPYFDNYSNETQEHRTAYRRLALSNAYVKSALLDVVFGVSSLDLSVKPAKTKKSEKRQNFAAAEFLEWALTEGLAGGVPRLVEAVLFPGLIDGYSVCDAVLGPVEQGKWTGKICLEQLKDKDTGNDIILQVDDYRNVVGLLGIRYNGGAEFTPGGFVIWANLPPYGLPTGTSELRCVYTPAWFLDTVEKLRGVALQLRAQPIPLITYQGNQESVRNSIIQQLSNLTKNAFLTAPEGVKAQMLDLAGSSIEAFNEALRDYKHDIYQGITGQTLSSLEGQIEDGRGNTTVHKNVADLRVWRRAKAMDAVVNDRKSGLGKSLLDLNFILSDYPKISLAGVDPAEIEQDLKIVQQLKELGYDVDEEELAERVGWKIKRSVSQGVSLPGQPGSQPPGEPPPGGASAPPDVGNPGGAGPKPPQPLQPQEMGERAPARGYIHPQTGDVHWSEPEEYQSYAEVVHVPQRLVDLAAEFVQAFSEDASGHEHKGKGEGGGQFTSGGGGAAAIAARKYQKTTSPSDFGKQHYSGWADSLGADEIKAIKDYKKDSTYINTELRDGGRSVNYKIEPTIKALNRAMSKTSVPHDLVVWRGAHAEFYNHLNEGDTFRDNAFISTSVQEVGAIDFTDIHQEGKKGVLITIMVPKGARGAYISQVDNSDNMDELLLHRGSRFKVMKKKAGRMLLKLIPGSGRTKKVQESSGESTEKHSEKSTASSRFVWVPANIQIDGKPGT